MSEIDKLWQTPGTPVRDTLRIATYLKEAFYAALTLRVDCALVAHDPAFWREVLRVLKPGAHLAAAAGTRTYHRLACAIEDAGFEIRDQIHWLYGSGFPKSHDQGEGRGTALKPACEPFVLARKPLVGTVIDETPLPVPETYCPALWAQHGSRPRR